MIESNISIFPLLILVQIYLESVVYTYNQIEVTFRTMKRIKYIILTTMILLLVYGFNSGAKDHFKKLKTLTQIIRLVNDNYVEDVVLEIEDGKAKVDWGDEHNPTKL